jgi:hypothetical protein
MQPGIPLPRKRGRGPALASVAILPDHLAALLKDAAAANASFDSPSEVYGSEWAAEDRTKRLRSAMAPTIQQMQPTNTEKPSDSNAGTSSANGGVAGFSVGMKLVYRDDAVSFFL